MSLGFIQARMEASWNAYQQSSDGVLKKSHREWCIDWLKANNSEDLIPQIFPQNKIAEIEVDHGWISKVVSCDLLTPNEALLVLKSRYRIFPLNGRQKGREVLSMVFKTIDGVQYSVGEE